MGCFVSEDIQHTQGLSPDSKFRIVHRRKRLNEHIRKETQPAKNSNRSKQFHVNKNVDKYYSLSQCSTQNTNLELGNRRESKSYCLDFPHPTSHYLLPVSTFDKDKSNYVPSTKVQILNKHSCNSSSLTQRFNPYSMRVDKLIPDQTSPNLDLTKELPLRVSLNEVEKLHREIKRKEMIEALQQMKMRKNIFSVMDEGPLNLSCRSEDKIKEESQSNNLQNTEKILKTLTPERIFKLEKSVENNPEEEMLLLKYIKNKTNKSSHQYLPLHSKFPSAISNISDSSRRSSVITIKPST